MATLIYNPCLLVTTTDGDFGLIRMQTDDTLGLLNQGFLDLEEKELLTASFIAKPKETLLIELKL